MWGPWALGLEACPPLLCLTQILEGSRCLMPKAWWELVYVHCGAGEGWAGAGGAVQLGAVSAAAGRRQWLGVAGDSSG